MTDAKPPRPLKPAVGQIWESAPDPTATELGKRYRILAVVEGHVMFRAIYGSTHMLRVATFMKWHRLSDSTLTPDERQAERMGTDLENITRRQIFAGARFVAERQYRHMPNWAFAKVVFGVGSTYAWELCREMGIDGDATSFMRHP